MARRASNNYSHRRHFKGKVVSSGSPQTRPFMSLVFYDLSLRTYSLTQPPSFFAPSLYRVLPYSILHSPLWAQQSCQNKHISARALRCAGVMQKYCVWVYNAYANTYAVVKHSGCRLSNVGVPVLVLQPLQLLCIGILWRNSVVLHSHYQLLWNEVKAIL